MPSINLKAEREFEKRNGILNVSEKPRFFSILKYILPLFSFILLVLIVIWPYIKDLLPSEEITYTAEEALGQSGINTAKRPQFNGVDRKNQPYILVSDYGIQIGDTETTLTNPHLTLKLNSGETVTLSSNKAYYNKEQEKIHLTDNVVLTHTTGYRFNTTSAWIDLKDSQAYGDQPVDGDGPSGKIKSPQGFRLYDKGDRLVFFGRSELLIANSKE